jgi:hypothetical protein
MQCPPGLILNKRTLRCVLPTGRVGRELYAEGDVRNAEIKQAINMFQYGIPRRTRKNYQPRIQSQNPYYVPVQTKPARQLYAPPYVQPALFPERHTRKACPPGYERNELTQRCIKIGAGTYKKLHPVAPAPFVSPMTNSDRLAVGLSGAAPMEDKESILKWVNKNCKFYKDSITGKNIEDYDLAALQNLVRIHDGSCTLGSKLNDRIVEQHKANKIATLPYTNAHMTLGDFKAVKEAMRRTNPGYKIPARRHIPPPPSWKLYIATDNRSGPEYISILYYDILMMRTTATGNEYPLEGIRVDLGFLPMSPSIQTLLDLIQKVALENKLLNPVAGGWKPAYGFPYSKGYWALDRSTKIQKLYKLLSESPGP